MQRERERGGRGGTAEGSDRWREVHPTHLGDQHTLLTLCVCVWTGKVVRQTVIGCLDMKSLQRKVFGRGLSRSCGRPRVLGCAADTEFVIQTLLLASVRAHSCMSWNSELRTCQADVCPAITANSRTINGSTSGSFLPRSQSIVLSLSSASFLLGFSSLLACLTKPTVWQRRTAHSFPTTGYCAAGSRCIDEAHKLKDSPHSWVQQGQIQQSRAEQSNMCNYIQTQYIQIVTFVW